MTWQVLKEYSGSNLVTVKLAHQHLLSVTNSCPTGLRLIQRIDVRRITFVANAMGIA
jgi:hypothetical protein